MLRKLRACIEVAVRCVRRRSSRNVKFVHLKERSHLKDARGQEVDNEDAAEEPVTRSGSGSIIVRKMSGDVVHEQGNVGDGTPVMEIVKNVCENTSIRHDEVHLVAGDSILEHEMILGKGDCISHPGEGETLEVCMAIVPGPPVTVLSASGSRIEVLDGVPAQGDHCHFDRDYVFTFLGDFAKKKGMRYVMTSNGDRKTPAQKVMWQLDVREPATVFLNFRSQNHVRSGGASEWLQRDGWELHSDFKSAISSGYPNGPYHGPVYGKKVFPQNRKCLVNLMGSNYWEGTYFVFIQSEEDI